MTILPDVPRLPTARNKIADCVFVLLLVCSRSFYVIGAALGFLLHGFVGFVLGLVAGAFIGFWMRRSLGAQGGDLTQGYHFRMHERGLGKRPRLLEALVEVLRGNRPTMTQCRGIAGACAEAARELQGCGSTEERAVILAKRDRQVLEIAYGESAIAAYRQGIERTDEVPEPAAIGENSD